MSNKQLGIFIAGTVLLALTLAWVIERAQIRRFMYEFDEWAERKLGGKSDGKSDR